MTVRGGLTSLEGEARAPARIRPTRGAHEGEKERPTRDAMHAERTDPTLARAAANLINAIRRLNDLRPPMRVAMAA